MTALREFYFKEPYTAARDPSCEYICTCTVSCYVGACRHVAVYVHTYICTYIHVQYI